MRWRSPLSALASAFLASAAMAADPVSPALYGSGPAGAYPPGIMSLTEDFGPGTTIASYSFVALRPFDSTFDYATGAGTTAGFGVYPKSASTESIGTVFSANIDLPEGALIEFARINVCNANGPAPGLIFGLSRDTGPITPGVMVGATNGCVWYSTGPIGYQTASKLGHYSNLFVNWGSGAKDGSVVVQAAEIGWHRQVSPAPATATFGDVPTTHPFFQFIEAMQASGITGGCGGGNYCPNNPVLRGQMAVFLAKGLGLAWPTPAP